MNYELNKMETANHLGTQPLQTPRLLLRRFTMDDAQNMFDLWCNDPEVTRFLSWAPHGTIDKTKRLLKSWKQRYEDTMFYNWCIEFEGLPIGGIDLIMRSEKSLRAELGYCLSNRYKGRGLVTEAACAVLTFAFEDVGLHKICAKHDVENPASGRIMQKLGMRQEGYMKLDAQRLDGTYSDMVLYGILRDEWLR